MLPAWLLAWCHDGWADDTRPSREQDAPHPCKKTSPGIQPLPSCPGGRGHKVWWWWRQWWWWWRGRAGQPPCHPRAPGTHHNETGDGRGDIARTTSGAPRFCCDLLSCGEPQQHHTHLLCSPQTPWFLRAPPPRARSHPPSTSPVLWLPGEMASLLPDATRSCCLKKSRGLSGR